MTEIIVPPTPPAGFELGTFWHPDHSACPKDPLAQAIAVELFVPIDKTGWDGAECGACGQQLET